MSNLYNPLKLSEHREKFGSLHLLVVGAGAVGTTFCECACKMGIGQVVILDPDSFTLENAAKHGCIVRTPEDVGKNKALTVAERMKPLLDDGCTAHGIAGELRALGPRVLAQFDVVVCLVDNYDAKFLLSQLVHRLPPEARPMLLMAGTYHESASSVLLDGHGPCLRCLLDESWRKVGSIHHSCTGVHYMEEEETSAPVIVRTSHLASAVAAHLAAEQLRAAVLGDKTVLNKRLSYTASPALSLDLYTPLRKKHCPDCAMESDPEPVLLPGSVLDTTVDQTVKQLSQQENAPVELLVYASDPSRSDRFVEQSVCHCCGKPIRVMKPESRLRLSDLRCDACREAGRTAFDSVEFDGGSEHRILRAFSAESSAECKALTLYEAGYPLGAYLQYLVRKDGELSIRTAALAGDPDMLLRVNKLD